MSVLVTGASGFLGGRLAQILLGRGEQVVVLARPTSDLRHLPAGAEAAGQLRVVRGGLGDPLALREAVRGATYIFHCAACSTDWAPLATYEAANVAGTDNLVAAAREAPGLQRFLHVSTTDVYGYPDVPCAEDHSPVDAGLPYNRTKCLAEAIVWQARADHGLPVTVLRPATIYGPRGKDFTVEIAKMLRGRMMATIDGGAAPGGFVYVDTVAQAMIDAAQADTTEGQAYNIAEGSGTTWAQYLGEFSRQLGTRPPWIDLPFPVAMGLARALEAPHRLLRLGGRPLLTRHAVYLLGRSQEFPIAKAQADFGFTPGVSGPQTQTSLTGKPPLGAGARCLGSHPGCSLDPGW